MKVNANLAIFWLTSIVLSSHFASAVECSKVAKNRFFIQADSATLFLGNSQTEPVGIITYDQVTVANNLGIHVGLLGRWKQSQSTVVIVGEGPGYLLPVLKDVGVPVLAFDPLYAKKLDAENMDPQNVRQADQINGYRNTHKENLIAATGEELPLKSDSADVVLTHMLINNFPVENQAERQIVTAMLKEQARVLKKGGIAINAFAPDEPEIRIYRMFLDHLASTGAISKY